MPALAEVYRRFSESVAATSPLYERVALALSASEEALGAIASPGRRHPAAILAALHDLALAGRAPDLAAAYAAQDADAAASAAIDTLLRTKDLTVRRRVRAAETGRHAVFSPAVTEAARRVGANAV